MSDSYWNTHPQYRERQKILHKKWTSENKERRNKIIIHYNKRMYHKRRLQIIRLLGGKCSNPHCLVPNGCADERCLQIDHVNGGGCKELHKLNPYTYLKRVLESVEKGEGKYQLLCANCNAIKKVVNHES